MDEPIVDTKKKPRGKPFTGGDDPRRNRKGKPKTGESLAEKVRNALAEAKDEKNPDYTKLDALLDKMVTKALAGDQPAAEYLLARGWGKMLDRLEITPRQHVDLSKLTDEEYQQYKMLHSKLLLSDHAGTDTNAD